MNRINLGTSYKFKRQYGLSHLGLIFEIPQLIVVLCDLNLSFSINFFIVFYNYILDIFELRCSYIVSYKNYYQNFKPFLEQ